MLHAVDERWDLTTLLFDSVTHTYANHLLMWLLLTLCGSEGLCQSNVKCGIYFPKCLGNVSNTAPTLLNMYSHFVCAFCVVISTGVVFPRENYECSPNTKTCEFWTILLNGTLFPSNFFFCVPSRLINSIHWHTFEWIPVHNHLHQRSTLYCCSKGDRNA